MFLELGQLGWSDDTCPHPGWSTFFVVCVGGVGISTEGGSAEDIRVAGAERRKSEPVREPFLREEPEREL